MENNKFKREQRYIIAKIKDVHNYLTFSEQETLYQLLRKIEQGREKDKKVLLECVCIQSNWKCYENAWKLVENEVNDD